MPLFSAPTPLAWSVSETASAPRPRHHRTHLRSPLKALLAFLLAIALVVVPGAAATADPGDPEYLWLTKSVSDEHLVPGQTFTYRITVECDESNCLDAQLRDPLPTGLAGFEVVTFSATPGASTVPRDITWTSGGSTSAQTPATIDGATELVVDFTGGATGNELVAGSGITIELTLKVPEDYPPGESGDIVNTATTSADNAAPEEASATVDVTSAVVPGIDVSKSWSPAAADLAPGDPSTVSVGAKNTSNVSVPSMTLEEPLGLVDGATALDPATNPFAVTDLTGLDDVALPQTCTTTQVDVYVQGADGRWQWRTGPPSSTGTLALPADVEPADVGGLRVTCTGSIEPQQELSFDLDLVQDAPGIDTYAVDNTVQGSLVPAEGQDAISDTASATHTITPRDAGVTTTKDFSEQTIAAGESTTATVTAAVSEAAVSELRVSDRDFFTDAVSFGGFTTPIAFPAGASAGSVVYYGTDGQVLATLPLVDGQLPPAPPAGAVVTGFDLVLTGDIPAGESVSATFGVDTTEAAAGPEGDVTLTNTVEAAVTDPRGQETTATDSDDVRIIAPGLDVTIDKTIRPGAPVYPGQSVVTSLETTVTAQTDTSTAHDLVIEDSSATNPEFWDAFDLAAISPMQLPGGTSMTVEVLVGEPGRWVSVETFAAEGSTRAVEVTAAQLAAAGIDPATAHGVRFSLHSDDGFPATATVTPVFSSTARSTLRDGGAITPGDDQPTAYGNTATADATGTSDGGTAGADDDEDSAEGTVVTDETGPGPIGIDKAWTQDQVVALSGQQAGTTLSWSVGEGIRTVAITDPAQDPSAVAGTAYDAFDLVALDPVAPSAEPFSNGWYLRYDTVTQVELYDGNGWVTVAAPAGGWAADGAFVGYRLTDAERASTLGVRYTLEENTAAREAAAQAGDGFDAFAPKPGTGITVGQGRAFGQTWQVRETKRSDDSYVTGHTGYNVPGADNLGVVDNAAAITGEPFDGDTVRDTDADTILIIDGTPGVEVSKDVTTDPAQAGGQVFVPPAGTPAADYPTAQWSMTAHSTSLSPAQQVRVTDPSGCADTDLAACQGGAFEDPFAQEGVDWLALPDHGTPFDRFDLTGITVSSSKPEQVDRATSVVWLLSYDDGTYSTRSVTPDQAEALTPEELADVIGVSVTFAQARPGVGTITQDNDLTIVLDTRLRATVRTTGESTVLPAGSTVAGDNHVFAQSYDEITAAGARTGDTAKADVTLTGGDVSIVPTKSVTPDALTPPTGDTPVTVQLGASSGTAPPSTLSPSAVTLEDQAASVDFWDHVDLTGLGAVTLPDGADQVRVDVYADVDGQGARWIEGSAASAATLPVTAEQYSTVQGIRFTFTRADGGYFSAAVPSPAWQAGAAFTVQLRDTLRGSGEDVEFEGTLTNTQTAQSTRTDGNDTAPVDASDDLGLSEGTHELEVNKLTDDGNRFHAAGDQVPFRLTLTNSGTGYLTLTELTDTLPAQLVFTGASTFTATPQDGGTLSGDVTLDVSEDGHGLTFRWPTDGATLTPGETFVIDLTAEQQPGLRAGEQAVNTMTAATAETLERCGNIEPEGSTTEAWATDPTTCGTTDYIQAAEGNNVYVRKGVLGSVEGAYAPGQPDTVCSPTLTSLAGEGFYPAPCVANSVVGGTDTWLLHAVNAGTVDVQEMVFVDQLPVPGDKLLLSGSSRGSQYRPQLTADSIDVDAPEGAAVRVEVSQSPDVCTDGWLALEQPTVDPCTENGETWTSAEDPTVDWAAVTGIRVFASYPDGRLFTPGEGVDVTFRTTNTPASQDSPDGASTAVPVVDTLADNQFGFRWVADGEVGTRAPDKVGVHLMTTSLQVTKTVSGEAARFAPDTFTADVTCRIGDVPIDLGDSARDTLTREGDVYPPVRIDGIPYSASPLTTCTVTETGSVGEFGETSRTSDPADGVLELATATDPLHPDAAVPAEQRVTLGNVYEFGSLQVTKTVATDAVNAPPHGPFTFTLVCTGPSGAPVDFGEELGGTTATFTIADGATWTSPDSTLPAGSACVLTETDSKGADLVLLDGDGVTPLEGGTAADVAIGTDGAARDVRVDVVNSYPSGTFTLTKQVEGDGAELYGAGPFTFEVVCTLGVTGGRALTVLDEETVVLAGGETYTSPQLPIGALCTATETDAGGATTSTISDGGRAVIGTDGHGTVLTPALVATNRFDVTSLVVTKAIAGSTSAPGAQGPFTVTLVCTMPGGAAVPIPGGADRTLSAATSMTATYDDLPLGADCGLTESATGGADSTTTAVTAGEGEGSDETTATITTGADGSAVTVTNTFAPAPTPGPTPTDGPSSFPTSSGSPGGGPTATSGSASAAPDGGRLPRTGADLLPIAILAALVTLAGAGLLVVRSIRRRDR